MTGLKKMYDWVLGHYTWIAANGEFTGFANFFFNNIPGFPVSLYNTFKSSALGKLKFHNYICLINLTKSQTN